MSIFVKNSFIHKTLNNKISLEVVFLQHGLLGTSADYVMGDPEKSLGRYIVSVYACDENSIE